MSDRVERRRARLDAERARRRKLKREKRRRGPAVVAATLAVLGVVVGGAAIALRSSTDDDADRDNEGTRLGRRGSTVVDGAPDIDVGRSPASMRVVYRVETAGESVSIVTDTLTTRRPYESRLETLSGPPPGKGTPTARVGWFLGTATVTRGTDPLIIQAAPGPPPTDLRLEATLAEAVERKLVERREVRRVLDRSCQVFRSRETLAAPMRRAEESDFVDTCIDDAGIVLEEVVTVGGDALTRRVAVDVVEDPTDIDDGLFKVEGAALPAESGGAFVRKLKDGSSPPGEFYVLDAPPDGFTHEGRYSVVPSQPENFGDDPTREGFRRAGTVDVWRRGDELITLDQGGTLRGEEPFEPVAGAPHIDVPPLGQAELILSGVGVEIRIAIERGRYVRITGTRPLDELLAIAAALRATPGGTLEFAD